MNPTPPLFQVEHYRSGVPASALEQIARRVRAAADAMGLEGETVELVSATIVPADDYLVCLFAAASESIVRRLYQRAGIECERLSLAIAVNQG